MYILYVTNINTSYLIGNIANINKKYTSNYVCEVVCLFLKKKNYSLYFSYLPLMLSVYFYFLFREKFANALVKHY